MSNEELLRDTILEHIGDEKFCENCPAMWYDNSTGTYECPACDNPYNSECYRNSEWCNIVSEVDKFLDNIRQDWAATA